MGSQVIGTFSVRNLHLLKSWKLVHTSPVGKSWTGIMPALFAMQNLYVWFGLCWIDTEQILCPVSPTWKMTVPPTWKICSIFPGPSGWELSLSLPHILLVSFCSLPSSHWKPSPAQPSHKEPASSPSFTVGTTFTGKQGRVVSLQKKRWYF